MKWGFEHGRFFVEHAACTRPPASLYGEALIRAHEIYSKGKPPTLCVSSGLDSQIALISFVKQGIPFEAAFLRLGGYNENEHNNLKQLEKRWGFKSIVIDIDPNQHREEIEYLKQELDVHANHCIQHMFVSRLNHAANVVQVLHDPWTVTRRDTNKHYLFQSWYDPEIARFRALDAVPNRTGEIIMFGDSSEFFVSCFNDALFEHFYDSWVYYNQNGLTSNGTHIPDVLRYDYYIKPMLYAKHWGSDLIYFPKFSGYENIDWLYTEVRNVPKKHQCFLERSEFLRRLLCLNGAPFRQYAANLDHS